MRFNHKSNNNLMIKILFSILLLINLIKNSNSVINGSQIQSNTQQNHITNTDRPQHYYFCGLPPSIANANSNLMRNQKHNVFRVGEIATYSCDLGYTKKSGKEQIQCLAREEQSSPRWEPLDLICEIVKCSDPGFVANANRKGNTNWLEYNTNVIYDCLPGFRMIGVPFLTCKADGKWNRQKPSCQMKRCPELNNLENGRIIYSDIERKTDSKLEYACNTGYKLNINKEIVRYCRQDDTWSDLEDINVTFLQCLVVKCETPIRPHTGLRIIPPKPKYGQFFKPGEVIIFSCDTYERTKASAKCLADGSWSRGPPHCPERLTTCAAIIDFAHGFYNVTNTSAKDYSSHKVYTRIVFYCESNYILDGSASLLCLPSGQWNASIPKCAFNDSLHQSQSSQLTILISTIAALVVLVFLISCILVCRWRSQQLQRRRWQQYFGHYNHRQSKTNIMLNTNEMKCFRQTPPKPTVPVTDL